MKRLSPMHSFGPSAQSAITFTSVFDFLPSSISLLALIAGGMSVCRVSVPIMCLSSDNCVNSVFSFVIQCLIVPISSFSGTILGQGLGLEVAKSVAIVRLRLLILI